MAVHAVRRRTFTALLCAVFASGAAGLVYQVAWTKALGLVFGHTVYAITTVLAAFMGGLAAGSAVLGRWSARSRRPIRLYATIEFAIAATGVLTFAGLYLTRALYLEIDLASSGSAPLMIAARFLGSFLVLLPPTFLMGGTLPILVAGVVHRTGELGVRLGRLYWINTGGAVLGAIAAGFVLLPGIGVKLTIAAAALLNIAAGTIALTIGDEANAGSPAAEEDSVAPSSPKGASELLWSFGIVGATAMSYEVAWSRLLMTTLGSSTYAFTIMLATFLVGIVLGGWLFELVARRRQDFSMTTFATTQSLTGGAAMVFLMVFGQLPALLWAVVTLAHKTFAGLVAAQFVTAVVAMLPAAVVFGFNFPLVGVLVTARRRVKDAPSAAVGRACAANTLGAIAGAMAAGFWLVPSLGAARLIAATAVVNLVLAAWVAARHARRPLLLFAANAAAAGAVVWVGWAHGLVDRQTASFGVLTNRSHYPDSLKLAEVTHSTDLVFAEDGLNASVAVVRASDYVALRVNGKVDASTGDLLSQLMSGHLGAVFHPSPKRVLVIGFGSGMTVSAVARYPDVERIDCVEIEPAVVHAAGALERLNRGVLRDPRVHVILNDARNFLFTTRDQYDLIVSEPSNPWIAGVASLFTDEFYGQIRSRLAPGGMLVQWVQAYSIYPDDLKMVFATVSQRFPQVTAWRGEWGDVMLLAQSERAPLSLERLKRMWQVPGLREDYATLGLSDPSSILAYYELDDSDVRALAAGVRHDADDFTRLEYRAPRALLDDNAVEANMAMLARQRSHPLPAAVAVTDTRDALIHATETAAKIADHERNGELLDALAVYPASAYVERLRADWLSRSNRIDAARSAFEGALQLDPSSVESLEGVAELALRKNDYALAGRVLDLLVARDRGYLPALESYARLEYARKHFVEAATWQERRVALDPAPDLRTLSLLARFELDAGRRQDAERIAQDTLARDPYNAESHRILGELYWQASRWTDAQHHFESVIQYHPSWDRRSYVLLANVYRNLDRPDQAQSTLQDAARIFHTKNDKPTDSPAPHSLAQLVDFRGWLR